MSMSLSYISEACTIYCEGPVLNAIQLAQVYNDSKTFVDMPMIYDPNITLAAFNNLSNPNNYDVLVDYLNEYFLPAGSDLNSWVPTDFVEEPAFLSTITDMDYKSWASDLNQLWLILGREVNASVKENPQRHSYIPRNYPMIVPGGRFRESYYWDSWWIIRGLLVCDMSTTAQYVINNLIDDVNAFGFVPNGGRIYYLDRSQPPLLSEMVNSYTSYMVDKYGTTQDIQTYLTNAFNALLKEYSYWMSDEYGQCVNMPPQSSNPASSFRLNRYYSNYTTPRPESYLADYDNARLSSQPMVQYYRQIRAGAETGWDFSSRWIWQNAQDMYNLTDIHTNEVIPIDLNSIMYRLELNMASFAVTLAGWATDAGNDTLSQWYTTQSTQFTQAASDRSEAINSYLWDGTAKHWRDYNLTSQQWTQHSSVTTVSASSAVSSHSSGAHLRADQRALSDAATTVDYSTVAYWVPLWAGLTPSDGTTADELVSSLQGSGLLQPGGVLTTTVDTEQQWDAPDSWPPEVMFTIEGLQMLNTDNSLNLATELTQLWLNTCYIAYNNTGYMYEKYNAYEVGVGGGGGEYVPQVGFGWSNAVALILLQQTYATPANSGSSDGSNGLKNTEIIVIASIATFIGLLLAAMVFLHYVSPIGATDGDGRRSTGLNLSPLSPTVSGGSMHAKDSLYTI